MELEADIVAMAAGVIPNVDHAKEDGIQKRYCLQGGMTAVKK